MAMRASFPKKDSNRVTSHARGADRAFTFHLLRETVDGLLILDVDCQTQHILFCADGKPSGRRYGKGSPGELAVFWHLLKNVENLVYFPGTRS
jgi:hypothetical protein